MENFYERPGRGVGNTTRQVDYAVQLLFDGYTVKAVSHSGNDKYLFDKIVCRMTMEHPRVIKNLKHDLDNLTLSF